MCDVMFITPNMDGEIASEAMGTLSLASILKVNGITCDILPFFRIGNLDSFNEFTENVISIVAQAKPKIVSFYTRCDVYHIELKLAELIKAKWPDICIVCGGPQSDITSEATLLKIPYVDYICCGEGESTVFPFFSSILQGTPDLSTPGLVYRSKGEIIKNPRPKMIDDLDSLPMLDYSLLNYSGTGMDKRKEFPIEVGRGCPFCCTFCSTNTFWGRKYRLKSPERIYLEIKDAHEKYGVTRFKFTHDMFTLNRNKVIETCKYLRTLDFPVQWAGSSRIDCLDRELIDIMVDAGMFGLFLGVETGSPRMQKIIKKNLDLENAIDIVQYLSSKKVKVKASYIFGFPEETEEDLSYTIDLIARMAQSKHVSSVSHLCAFFVGTELSQKYSSAMTPVDYYSNETGAFAVEECKDLIETHPDLFQHMLEYKTELRSKLMHFELFLRVWQHMQPVYQYISEKYPTNRLIDMYYDFAEANKDIFDSVYAEPESQWGLLVVAQDRFPLCFADDENYDKISDYYRFRNIEASAAVQNGQGYSEVFCFNPLETKKKPLQDCTRCVAVVTRTAEGRSVSCYPLAE